MSKKKNHVINAQSINICLTVACVILAIVCIVLAAMLFYKSRGIEELDVPKIFEKSATACLDYEYAQLVITRQESVSGETYTAEYVVSDERDGSYCTYMFRDSEDNDLYQCWLANESGSYDAYIRAKDLSTWVKTSVGEEPVSTNLWDMFSYAGGYVLMDSDYPWYDTGDPCYVLQRTGTVDSWSSCYEEVYIRKSDFLPMGIVLIIGNPTEDIDHTDVETGVKIGDDTADISTSVFGYDSIVQKYSIEWSHEDMRLFDVPDTFITDEEYLSITNGQEGEPNGED